MSWNYCCISGNTLEEPVISKKSGYVFEKKVIEKHIEANQTCPKTGQPLSLDDIIPIQISKTIKPRPVNATSIPNLLTIFQSEWDSLMLETYTLKQHLETVRQELSHALYQHDAACRVIARLIRERDDARNDLTTVQERIKKGEAIDIENGSEAKRLLPNAIIQNINDTAIRLNKQRKDRKNKGGMLDEFAGQEQISNFNVKSSITLHSTTKPGISSMDFSRDLEKYIVTGGVDGTALIYDSLQQNIAHTFEQHTKKINEIVVLSDIQNLNVFTASDDNTGCFYTYNIESNKVKINYTVKQHKLPLTSVAVHPIKTLAAFASKDSSWSFHDIAKGEFLSKVDQFGKDLSFSKISFHPDGHLLGVGCSDGTVKLWNITEDSVAAGLNAHESVVDSIAFSENGYYFATGSIGDGLVKIWDLRKLQNIQTFFEQEKQRIGSLAFDSSGQFLCIGTDKGLNTYYTKNWESFSKFDTHKDLVTDVKFGKFSKSLVSCSLDRHLTFYS